MSSATNKTSLNGFSQFSSLKPHCELLLDLPLPRSPAVTLYRESECRTNAGCDPAWLAAMNAWAKGARTTMLRALLPLLLALCPDATATVSGPTPPSFAAALDLAPRGRKSGGEVGYDKHVCFGYNTNAGCSGAKAPIPLYSNAKVTTTCSDCYAALDADVFVNITIKGWKLESLAAGFTNVNLNSSAVFDAKASAQWSVGIDKTLKLVATDYLLDFKIGPVPFMLFFDVPLEVKGDLTFNTAAEVTLGVTSGIALGSTYVSWDPTRHWQHTKPEFVPSLTPQLATSASLDATADIQLMPSFNVHFDRIFSYSLTANPSLHAEITGSKASGKICMTSTYV